MLAFDDLFEALDCVFQLHVFPFAPGELRRDVEWLREELLNLARPRHDQLVFVRQFIETEDRDDVLKIFVALQKLLNCHRRVVVIFSDDARIENA
jgi:hypothetical protein